MLAWAGFLSNATPTKDELIIAIEADLAQMTPEGRKLAHKMIRALVDDHRS